MRAVVEGLDGGYLTGGSCCGSDGIWKQQLRATTSPGGLLQTTSWQEL